MDKNITDITENVALANIKFGLKIFLNSFLVFIFAVGGEMLNRTLKSLGFENVNVGHMIVAFRHSQVFIEQLFGGTGAVDPTAIILLSDDYDDDDDDFDDDDDDDDY
ncbi:unnamed protein product [Meganyctiphanes norvegica]|uniref:Uncharacterized protein n=1 Tax=Meganyctiphanes norvegica TaxID=48144 RepID=A0AAV2S0W4_MEGNR